MSPSLWRWVWLLAQDTYLLRKFGYRSLLENGLHFLLLPLCEVEVSSWPPALGLLDHNIYVVWLLGFRIPGLPVAVITMRLQASLKEPMISLIQVAFIAQVTLVIRVILAALNSLKGVAPFCPRYGLLLWVRITALMVAQAVVARVVIVGLVSQDCSFLRSLGGLYNAVVLGS